jgi:hypothetical protein
MQGSLRRPSIWLYKGSGHCPGSVHRARYTFFEEVEEDPHVLDGVTLTVKLVSRVDTETPLPYG